MTFSKAQQEFQIRYYLWATSEFDQEIAESLPSLSLFKSGSPCTIVQFMRQLDSAEQLILAHGLLKRFHPNAVKALGEDISGEEESLLSRYRAFCLIEDAKDISKRMFSRGIKFASKSKIRGSVLKRFKSTFGNECLELACVGLDPELVFKMKCCGWMLNTRFEFNGAHRQTYYWHTIMSPATIEPHGAPAMIIGGFITFNAWLGISSQTQWEYLMSEDVEPACDAVIQLCSRFFDVAPKLLKGLEFDKITSE